MADKYRFDRQLSAKIDHLRDILRHFDRIAVAFSGGIDSTVLLHNVCELFPADKVIACNVTSCLVSEGAALQAVEVFRHHFAGKCTLKSIPVNPMEWDEFAANKSDRCYICKKNMYSLLLNEIRELQADVLVDGTNLDDLGLLRPGNRAIQQLGIRTPLAEAQLTKDEIRSYGRVVGLINAAAPSNSCLATRLQVDVRITLEKLKKIEYAEAFLHSLGFNGCRVRCTETHTVLEVFDRDIERCAQKDVRAAILQQFNGIGFDPVYLKLTGR